MRGYVAASLAIDPQGRGPTVLTRFLDDYPQIIDEKRDTRPEFLQKQIPFLNGLKRACGDRIDNPMENGYRPISEPLKAKGYIWQSQNLSFISTGAK